MSSYRIDSDTAPVPELSTKFVDNSNLHESFTAQADGWPNRYRWETQQRYYEAWIGADLFGPVLVRVYGGKGSRMGRVQTTPGTAQQLETLLQQTHKKRLTRGYKPCLVA